MHIEEAWAQLHAAAGLSAARGSLVFHIDLATQVARVALAAQDVVPARLAVMVAEDGYRLFAFDSSADPATLREVRFTSGGEAQTLPAPDRLPARTLDVAQAHATITAAFPDHAAIVVPANDMHAMFEGYALNVGPDADVARIGGHRLLTLDPKGRQIRSDVALGADLGALPANRLRDTILDDAGAVPNEIHTYLSLKHAVPLTVATRASGARWRVDGERTTVV